MRCKQFVFVLVVILFASIFYFSEIASAAGFEVDSVLLKRVIKTEGSFSSSVRITNAGVLKKDFEVNVFDLENLASLDSRIFDLGGGKVKELEITFSNKNNLTESVYVGGLEIISGAERKLIPIILEIESRDVLFDSNVALFPTGRISPGDKINAEIKIYDLSQVGTASVDLIYFIKDFEGETIISESETIVVEDNVLITKSTTLPENLEPGDYVFGVALDYRGSVGTASSFFRVGKKKFASGLNLDSNFLYIIILFVIIFFAFLLFIFYIVYSRDKLLIELKNQYKSELRRQEKYLTRREEKVEEKLETPEERILSRKIFRKIKREKRKAIKVIHKQRVKKLRELKRTKKGKASMQSQIAKWKRQGYDVGVLEKTKTKIPSAESIKEKVQAWKNKGYNTSVLERR